MGISKLLQKNVALNITLMSLSIVLAMPSSPQMSRRPHRVGSALLRLLYAQVLMTLIPIRFPSCGSQAPLFVSGFPKGRQSRLLLPTPPS